MYILLKLAKIANKLDAQGFYKEASIIDQIIKTSASSSELIKALKNDDARAAHKALVGVNAYDLSITDEDFRRLAKYIYDAELQRQPDKIDIGMNKEVANDNMDKARKILGIGKSTPNVMQLDTKTHNPITGKPWASGPVQQTTLTKVLPNLRDKLVELKSIIDKQKNQGAGGFTGKYIVKQLKHNKTLIKPDAFYLDNVPEIIKDLRKSQYIHLPSGDRFHSIAIVDGPYHTIIDVDLDKSEMNVDKLNIVKGPPDIYDKIYETVKEVFN